MAESFVDTFKTELVADRSWRSRSQLELAVVEYVSWFNHERLHESLGDRSRGVRGPIRSTGDPTGQSLLNWKPTKTVSVKTRAYVERRTGEGKTKKEIIRCLKRYIAREVHASLRDDLGSLSLTS